MNHSKSAAVRNEFKSTYMKAARCSNSQISSTMPLPILKNISIIPVSKVPNDSSQTTSLNKKGIEAVLCQSKEQFAVSNLKIPSGISISPNNDIEKSIMLLKRLPNITFQVVNPKPVFKVPESPKLNPKKMYGLDNKSKTISESKVLSEKQNNIKVIEKNKNSKLFNTEDLTEKNSSFHKSVQQRKPEQNKSDNITVSSKNNYDTIISKIPIKNLCSEVKNTNTQKTSSPKKKLLKRSISSPSITTENLRTVNPEKKQKISTASTGLHEVKTISENSSVINNIEKKTPVSKDYLLIDLSSGSENNIVSALPPLDFHNVSLPEYDNFAMGISESPGESNMHLEISQNHIEKQEINISNYQTYVDSSSNLNKYIDVPIDLVPKSVFINESASLDSLKTDEMHVNMPLENK